MVTFAKANLLHLDYLQKHKRATIVKKVNVCQLAQVLPVRCKKAIAVKTPMISLELQLILRKIAVGTLTRFLYPNDIVTLHQKKCLNQVWKFSNHLVYLPYQKA